MTGYVRLRRAARSRLARALAAPRTLIGGIREWAVGLWAAIRERFTTTWLRFRHRFALVGLPLLLLIAVASLVLTTIPKEVEGQGMGGSDLQKVQLASLLDWGKLGAGVTVPRGLAPLAVRSRASDTLETTPYIVRPGDTISEIGQEYGISDETIISVNHVEDARLVQPGTVLLIPNMDGVLYRTKPGDTLEGIAKSYDVPEVRIVTANRLASTEIRPGEHLFIPGGHMSSYAYRRALGTLFLWPTHGWLTSPFGMRRDPFTGLYGFHNGIDLANSIGTPVDASADGQVVAIGANRIYGNYLLLDNGGGYQSLYAHLSRIYVAMWQWVRSGEQIAAMGDSGYSTGPHLHFSIFKDGVPVNPLIYLRY